MFDSIIGSTVTVTVDRALGTYHPKHNDIFYTVNYGYIDGVTAADGEYQDAYILGIDKPLKSFTGKVIAVIIRENDIENKWVVVPPEYSFDKAEIIKAVYFQEKYFDFDVII